MSIDEKKQDSPSDWSEWIGPSGDQYSMKCCGCGMVHELQFAAQRQWVGLTDAEIAEWDYDVRDVVMDIEKLLRDRNT